MHPQHLKQHAITEYMMQRVFNDNSSFSYISCFYHDKTESFPINMHKHTFYEINIIVSGSGWHYFKDQCMQATKGSIYVITPGVSHGYYTENEDSFKIFNLIINPIFIERYKSELSAIPGYSLFFEIEPTLRAGSSNSFFLTLDEKQLDAVMPDLDELNTLNLDSSNPGNDIAKIAKTLYLITVFSKAFTSNHDLAWASKRTNNKRVDSVAIMHTMEYIMKHFSEKLLVDDLAKISNMSRTTFLRQFKSLCKYTPMEYITELRINKAAELLKSGDMSISEISQECGFFDYSHFSHVFANAKHCSPATYRKSSTNI